MTENLGCRQILEAGANIKVDFDGQKFVPRKAGNVELEIFDRELLEQELVKARRDLGRVPYIVYTGDGTQMYRLKALFTLLGTSSGLGSELSSTYVKVKTNNSGILAEIEFIPGCTLENPIVTNVRGTVPPSSYVI
jgi:hypothetical protein